MNEPTALDRLSKLGPAITLGLFAVGVVAGFGEARYRLGEIARVQSEQRTAVVEMRTDLRKIFEGQAGMQVTSHFTQKQVAELADRVRELERDRRPR